MAIAGTMETEDPCNPAAELSIELRVGDLVEVHSLKSAAELNGQQGNLYRFDSDGGRWEVRLPDGTVKAVRAENLSFKAMGTIEDDGTLTLVGMATSNPTIQSLVKQLVADIPKGNEALQLAGHVVSPSQGAAAKGDEAVLWLKLAKQAEQRVRGTLEDLQKGLESVDDIDVSKLRGQQLEELKMARKDLVRFVQHIQERLEGALSRLPAVLRRLTTEVESSGKSGRHGWSAEDKDAVPLHEKYREAFDNRDAAEQIDKKNGSQADASQSGLKPIVVKYHGRGDNPSPSDNLYIKDLPGWVTEADVEAIFSEVGVVQSMKLKTADWGAIAFVRLASKKETAIAILQFNGTVPKRLADKAAKQEVDRKAEEAAKAQLKAVTEQLARGVMAVVDLTRPLGIFFSDTLVANSVMEGSQAAEMDIGKGWRARSIGGRALNTTDELVTKIKSLKDKGLKQAVIAFAPPPLVVEFESRPFGMLLGSDLETGLVFASEVNEPAKSKGVRPGSVLTMVQGQDVSGMLQMQVVELLRDAALPTRVVFEQAQGQLGSDGLVRLRPRGVAETANETSVVDLLAADNSDHEDAEVLSSSSEADQVAVVQDRSKEGMERIARGVQVSVCLSEPLGIYFQDSLIAKDVMDNLQAFRLGVRAGCCVRTLAGKTLKDLDDLLTQLQSMKAAGEEKVVLGFSRVPSICVFNSRPFGFVVDMDPALGLFVVTSVSGLAKEQNVQAGLALTKIGNDDVTGWSEQQLVRALREGILPLTIWFETVPPAGVLDLANGSQEAAATTQPIEVEDQTSSMHLRRDTISAPAELMTVEQVVEAGPSRGVREIEMDLGQPLGIFFDDALMVEDVHEKSQAANLGVQRGWRARLIGGQHVLGSDELVARIRALKEKGAPNVKLEFTLPPFTKTFYQRPFGFSVALHKDTFVVGNVNGSAASEGIEKGMMLTKVGAKEVSDLTQDALVELLKTAPLPVEMHFAPAKLEVAACAVDPPVSVVGLQPEPTTNKDAVSPIEQLAACNEGSIKDGTKSIGKRKTETKGIAGVGSEKEVQNGTSVKVDLTRPLGIFFDDNVAAHEVQPGSQAAELGVGNGWRALSIAGEPVHSTEDFVGRLQQLKAEGAADANILFDLPAKLATFRSRPFGFSVAYDEFLCHFVVGAVGGVAEAEGVQPGMILSKVGEQKAAGFSQDELVEVLKQVPLPAELVFLPKGSAIHVSHMFGNPDSDHVSTPPVGATARDPEVRLASAGPEAKRPRQR